MRIGAKPALLLLGTVSLVWILASFWRAGVRLEEAPPRTRYAFVLDGQGPRGVRVRHALELLREGRVDSVVVSGSPAGRDVSYSTLWVRELELTDQERGRFLELRSESRSTQDEARLADSVFASLGADTVVVVTSDFHVWRASSVFRIVNPGRVVFRWSAATDPFWASGLFHRDGAKMRAEEWTKRITWSLVESWLAKRSGTPAVRMVRGEEVGHFPPPRWK